MRPELLILTAFSLSLLFVACNQVFEPKTTIAEKYVVFSCYDFQGYHYPSVKLSRVYDIDGYDVNNYKIEPVLNAEVKIKSRGLERTLCENINRQNDGSVYEDTSFSVILEGQKAYLTINLKNGKTISAEAAGLNSNFVTYSYPFFNGFTTQLNRFLWGSTLGFSWKSNQTRNLFFARLLVNYSVKKDTVETTYNKELPFKYIKRNGINEAIFPSGQYTKEIEYDYTAIDSAIAAISAGETDKSKFKLYGLVFSLLEFNRELSDYYSSIHGYTDHFSIRLDESVYSNISPGLGVFGMKKKQDIQILFRDDYPLLFGYKGLYD